MLFYSFFKTLVGKRVTVELKNDLKITVRRRERGRTFFFLNRSFSARACCTAWTST
jgi:hypothetical protein